MIELLWDLADVLACSARGVVFKGGTHGNPHFRDRQITGQLILLFLSPPTSATPTARTLPQPRPAAIAESQRQRR
ncbi:hypothetical protein Y032_0414g1035 [Ancylostoma ceylanicum]|uniref:Uncharacterized protein n=1 Tax=Ancylostoma ceylanicum TaxID=53326 RepID=A0A016X1Y8_9BILA|nr:hypothetical protein Y032_0414g1035 [Ancylostoma ceylanicum]